MFVKLIRQKSESKTKYHLWCMFGYWHLHSRSHNALKLMWLLSYLSKGQGGLEKFIYGQSTDYMCVPRQRGEFPGWVSPCLPGHGHQHWRPDPKALRTPSLPKCLCLANLRQVLWSRKRKVLCSLPWNLAQSLQCFRDLTTICTVGFEPNIIHNKVLHQLEEQYQACGWRVGPHF